MQYCLAMKRVWLLLSAFSVASIVIGIPLIILSAAKLQYVPLAILMLFVCHGIWGAPFYIRAFKREMRTLLIIPHVLPIIRRGGSISYDAIGNELGITQEGVEFLVLRAVKRGYINF